MCLPFIYNHIYYTKMVLFEGLSIYEMYTHYTDNIIKQ